MSLKKLSSNKPSRTDSKQALVLAMLHQKEGTAHRGKSFTMREGSLFAIQKVVLSQFLERTNSSVKGVWAELSRPLFAKNLRVINFEQPTRRSVVNTSIVPCGLNGSWRWPSREESPIRLRIIVSGAIAAAGLTAAMIASGAPPQKGFNADFARNAQMMLDEGRKTFNYGTFWGDVLQLHEAIAGQDPGEHGAMLMISGPITYRSRLFVLHPILKVPDSSFDDVAMVRLSAGHLGIDKNTRPFTDGEIGRHDDGGALVALADQIELQLTAGLGEGQIAEFIEREDVSLHEMFCAPSLSAAVRRMGNIEAASGSTLTFLSLV
jgi:hypothetical protein